MSRRPLMGAGLFKEVGNEMDSAGFDIDGAPDPRGLLRLLRGKETTMGAGHGGIDESASELAVYVRDPSDLEPYPRMV